MKAYFNGTQIDNKITLPLNDRALQFGDGIFETMMYQHGRINYLHDHLTRLNMGLATLQLNPFNIKAENFIEIIEDLLDTNSILDTARIKLMVWRKGQRQKAYASSERELNYLIQVFRSDPIDLSILTSVGYAKSIRNFKSGTSEFKTLSSLHYVMGAQERDLHNMEELIILDHEENLSECIASNLFWIKDDKIFTPSLSTGCINGVMRKQLEKWCQELNVDLHQVREKKKVLRTVDHVFCMNVAGINIFNTIDSNEYTTKGKLLDIIIEKVLDPR